MAAPSALPIEQEEETYEVPFEPPAPRAPLIEGQIAEATLQIEQVGAELADMALAQAEGKPVSDADLRKLFEKRQTAQFGLEVKQLALGRADEVDAQAREAWKADVLSLDPEDIAGGISATECPEYCNGVCGCALSGFKQCLHPGTFSTFPNEIAHQGVSTAAWDAAVRILRDEGDDE